MLPEYQKSLQWKGIPGLVVKDKSPIPKGTKKRRGGPPDNRNPVMGHKTGRCFQGTLESVT